MTRSLAAILLVWPLRAAFADSFVSPDDGGFHSYNVTVLPGTSSFTINTSYAGRDAYWYLAAEQVEVDLNQVNPSYSYYFSSGSYSVSVDVYYPGSSLSSMHEWTVTVNHQPTTPYIGSTYATGPSTAYVNWTASYDADGDSMQYEVQYKQTGTGTWYHWAYVSHPTTYTTLSGLAASTYYDVKVIVSDGRGGTASDQRNQAFVTQPNNSPPTTPGSLSASSVTATNAVASWGASTDPNGDPITYDVDYQPSGGSWTSGGSTSATSLTLNGLAQLTSYNVRVRAHDNKSAYSGYSVSNNLFTTTALNRAPSAPPSVTVPSVAVNTANVNWGASTDPDGDPITYTNEYRRVADVTWTLGGATNGTNMVLSGLNAHTSYTVHVRAADNRAGVSAWTELASPFTTLDSVPTMSTSPGTGNISYYCVDVSWGASSDADLDPLTYEVQYQVCGSGSWASGGSSSGSPLTVCGLSPHTCYAVRVRANDGFGGLSAWNESAPQFTTVNHSPSTPGAIAVTSTNFAGANITWGAASDLDSDTITYDVQYRTCGSGTWAPVTSTTSVSTPVSGLNPHTCYAVRVRANDGFNGQSAWNELDPAFTTLNRPPVAPGLPAVASPGYTDGTVTWTPSTDADGDTITYDLEYKVCTAGSWTTAGSTTSPTMPLTGLTPHTCYALRVKAHDAYAGDSGWVQSNPAFTTLNHPPTLPGSLVSANVTFDAGRVTWGASTDADSDSITYEVEYRVHGAGTWTSAGGTAAAFKDFTGLTSHTGYDVHVRGNDGFGGLSDWQGASPAFTTLNHLPVVNLTSPAANALFTAPATIGISATATDSDGTITRVEFFAGTNKLGEVTGPPYSFTWQSVPHGIYSLTARATDDFAGQTTSSPVQIVVNERPTVSITSPTNGALFIAPQTVTVTVNAADVEGSVAKVELFTNGSKVGEATVAPYQFTLPGMTVGEYSFTAVATDNLGASQTSGAVAVSIHSNDLFVDRKRLSGTSWVARWPNTVYTAEAGELAHAGWPAQKSAWWSWVAPSSGTVTVSTYGSSFDTRLAVYTGASVGSLALVAQNDDDGQLTTSRVCFGAVAGTEYQIAVDGYDGAAGDIVLTLAESAPGTVSIATGSPLPTATVGVGYAQSFVAAGDCGGFGWAQAAGTLPPGLSLDGTGVLSGIPAAAGTYAFTVRATGAGGSSVDKAFTMNVNAGANTPANDLFANARVLSGMSATDTGSNVGASEETGEPGHAGSVAERSVWWVWTAPQSGHVTIDTHGSSFDTRLAVYTGTALANLQAVAANDDDGQLTTSRVRFDVASGTRYYIALDGYDGDSGTIQLSVVAGTGPGNDNLADAYALQGGGVSTTGNNIGATQEAGEAAHTSADGGQSVWWTWTAPDTGLVTVSTVGSRFDTVLWIFTGDTIPALEYVASDDDSGPNLTSMATFTATAGATYRIVVDGYLGDEGNIALSVNQVAGSAPPEITTPSELPGGTRGVNYRVQLRGMSAAGSLEWSILSGTQLPPALGMDVDGNVSGLPSAIGTFSFRARATDARALYDERDFTVSFAGAVGAPANDLFVNARSLTVGSPDVGSNASATMEAGEPNILGIGGGKTVWWKWTAASAGLMRISTLGSSFDTVLAVYTGNAVSALTLVAANDDYISPEDGGGAGAYDWTSETYFNAAGGTTYYFAVDGRLGDFGSVVVDLEAAGVLTPCSHIVRVGGDLAVLSGQEMAVELCQALSATEAPLVEVQGGFSNAGRLRLSLAPGYEPKPGDRFRLIEFEGDTTSVADVYQRYAFKDYDPNISGYPDRFWGLCYRVDQDGRTFIDVLVLHAPQVWHGATPSVLAAMGNAGLVFATHGTRSSIGAVADDGFATIAAQTSTWLSQHGDTTWDVVTLDWGEYSTHFFPIVNPFSTDFAYNAATSAQIGIGIGESFTHWLQANGFAYSKMHLMSHSSGSWLVNRMAQLASSSATVHLTFFDAFTNPAEDCIFPFFCGRFEDSLGGAGVAFAEHYVDRTFYLPPGTNERLPGAVNFDVTLAWSQSSPHFALSSPFLWDWHGWPYKWYLGTIKLAVAGTLPTTTCDYYGFPLAPEFLQALPASSGVRQAIETAKAAMASGDEFAMGTWGCSQSAKAQSQPQPQFFTQARVATTGTFEPTADGIVVYSDGTEVSVPVNADRPVAGLTFSFRFQPAQSAGSASNCTLSVSVDGNLVTMLSQEFLGTGLLTTGNMPLQTACAPGPHEVVFRLASPGGAPASVLVRNVELAVDARSSFQRATRLAGGQIELAFLPMLGRTNHVIEASSDLVTWLAIATVASTNQVIHFTDPDAPNHPYRFYRVLAP